MSDQVQLHAGSQPWLPTAGAAIVDVLDEYDGPLLAVIEQSGTKFLARCLVGEMSPVNIWVYMRLDEHEATALREQSPAGLLEMVEYLTHGRLMAAMAQNDQIVLSVSVAIPEGHVMEKIAAVLAEVQNTLDHLSSGASQLNQALVRSR